MPTVSIHAALPLWFGGRLYIRRRVAQAGWAAEQEQLGYDRHVDAPPVEMNPVVPMIQEVVIRKWEEYLQRSGQNPKRETA